MGRRIAVVGASGSGKTTLSRTLASRLGVPHVELDALHHGPNWAEASAEELRVRVGEATAGDGWVVDGNYGRKIGDLVLAQADTVVWLDPPLAVILWRLWWRTARRIVFRVELWNGNRESLRSAFAGRESLFAWAIASHRTFRGELADRPGVTRLRSRCDVALWLVHTSGVSTIRCATCGRPAPPADSVELLEWKGGELVLAGELDPGSPAALELVCPDCAAPEEEAAELGGES